MTEYSKLITDTYWSMKGVTEFAHDCKPVDFVTGFPTKAWECSKCLTRKDWGELSNNNCPIPDPIPLCCDWALAGFMRSKLTDEQWQDGMRHVYCEEFQLENINEYGLNTDALMWAANRATAEQWIKAGCAAWPQGRA